MCAHVHCSSGCNIVICTITIYVTQTGGASWGGGGGGAVAQMCGEALCGELCGGALCGGLCGGAMWGLWPSSMGGAVFHSCLPSPISDSFI